MCIFLTKFANKLKNRYPILTLKEWAGHKDIKVLINSYYKLDEDDSVNFMKKV